MDGSIRVCALEYITSAYQHVYSGFYQSWSSFCLHAAIYLDECLASALFDELAQTAYLLDGVLDEFCPPKPGLTLIKSTMSTSQMMSSSTHTGVEGLRVTPAFMPAA